MLCQLCSELDLTDMWLNLCNFFIREVDGEYGTNFQMELSCDPRHYEPGSFKQETLFVPYHSTLEDLRKASEVCELCRTLLRSATMTGNFNQTSGGALFLCGSNWGHGIQLMEEAYRGHLPNFILLGAIGVAVEKDSPLSEVIMRRRLPTSLRSKDSLECIEKWLFQCSSSHEHHPGSTEKPTRLLSYRQETGKVFLCSSVPSDAKYAALSHCWGSVQPLTLNASTCHQLEEGLPFESFPQTFKDALWLVRELDIPYLWIDSLCIMQDDNQDWARESSRMSDVYGNAYLTIAATKASNCSEGFLGLEGGPEYTDIPCAKDGISANISIFPIPASHMGGWNRYIMEMEDEPLSKRAWVLQERYLSPRTLHFTHAQMYFECGSCFYAQDEEYELGRSEFEIRSRNKEDDGTIMAAWVIIVKQYSRRYLTVDSDKLPALGGLAARVFAGCPRDDYLAGIWRKELLSSLCWYICELFPKRRAPTSYIAPSWSWASVNHPVQPSTYGCDRNLVIVKGAKVYLENPENPFGKVTGGWIHLSAMKLEPREVDAEGKLCFREGDCRFKINAVVDPARHGLPAICLADFVGKASELVAVPIFYCGSKDEDLYCHYESFKGVEFLILIESKSGRAPIENISCFWRAGRGTVCREGGEGLKLIEVRTLLRERFLRQKEQGTLEDIILV